MSIFATIAVVCTLATCNDYAVDTAETLTDGVENTRVIDQKFYEGWGDEKQLTKWLEKYKIGETVFEIVSVEFETKEIQEDETP